MRKEILNNNHIQISENQLLNGFEIIFLNKMTDFELKEIKKAGFRWSKRQQFWYAKKNEITEKYIELLEFKYSNDTEAGKKNIKEIEEINALKTSPLTEEEIRKAVNLVPTMEMNTILEQLSGEEQVFYNDKIREIAAISDRLKDNWYGKSYNEKTKQHDKGYIHYFIGNSDFYICEYDGKDSFFGYSILNGNTDFSEFGMISRSEIMNLNPGFLLYPELDLHTDQNLTLEQAVNRKYPELFTEISDDKKYKKNTIDKVTQVSEVIYEENNQNKEETNESRKPGIYTSSESENHRNIWGNGNRTDVNGSGPQGNEAKLGGDSGERYAGIGYRNNIRNESTQRGNTEASSGYSSISDRQVRNTGKDDSNKGNGTLFTDLRKRELERIFTHDGGINTAFNGNLSGKKTQSEIIKVRKAVKGILLEKKDEEITPEDLNLLAQYEGAGGLKEHNRTENGILNEFYTPESIVEKVWQITDFYYPEGITVLEPSCGSGRFASNRKKNKFTMYESDGISARIAHLLHPEAIVINQAFQEQFFDENKRFINKNYLLPKYDIVIGNPPYGLYSDKYRGLGEGRDFLRLEEYFISRGLDSLKDKKSILVMVVPSSFLNSQVDKAKKIIALKGELVDAYRLPEKSFPTTDIGTDIVVFKKNGSTGINYEKISNSNWFKEHPEKILGEIQSRINRFGKKEEYVRIHTGLTIFDEIEKITTLLNQENEKKTNILDSRISSKQAEVIKNKRPGDILTIKEFADLYGKFYSDDELKIWNKIDWEGKAVLNESEIKNQEHFDDNYIRIEKNNFIHKSLFFSGDITDKINEYEKKIDTEKDTEVIKIYKKNIEILKNNIPEQIPFERIHFGVNTTFSENFEVNLINKDGTVDKITLPEAFIRWAQGFTLNTNEDTEKFIRGNINYSISNILREDIPKNINWEDIIRYIDKEPVKAERTTEYNITEDKKKELKNQRKKEADEKRMMRSETADKLFDRFIHSALDKEYQLLIEKEYNRKFNSYLQPDYSKLPLLVSGMSAYKGNKPFVLYEQQIKGIAFLAYKGNGLLAYDVGVGKTAAGIVSTVCQIQLNRSKKPLIIVPNSVYGKWVKDIKELFPNVQVNELYNLNPEIIFNFINRKDVPEFKIAKNDNNNAEGFKIAENNKNTTNRHELNIPKGSITVVTYEALKNITFTDESCENELFEDFSKLISESMDGSERENTTTALKIKNTIGKSAQVDNSDYIYFESCGFDHITVDEAHNFKNLWVVPRPENKGESNEYSGIPSGRPSLRAIKLYAMTQLVQKHNNDRNVFLLTATPFTNSPLEVYSMLSYIGRKRLIEAGIYTLRDFLNQFAQTKIEISVTPKGNIEYKQVMKNWKELPALQKILTEFIDKVDGEEAGIIRPEKITHINQLEMSELQKNMVNADIESMDDVRNGNSAAVIVAMNAMRLALVAPALADKTRYNNLNIKIPELKDLINTSPKLKFVCQSVIDLYKENPEKGQFIYVPLGQESHTIIKEYLISNGIPDKAIEIINGSINNTSEKKEKISQSFNNPGSICKIIIGGKNTCEGIDLNGNSFVMYNCSLGWNPTETIQAEGRIWRQGNLQNNVHCVYPIMNDSIDALLYQKHDEKRSRINELWSYKEDTLNVEDIKPEELKFDLIKNPEKKAKFVIKEKTKEIKTEIDKLNLRINNYDEIITQKIKIEQELHDKKSELENLNNYKYYDKAWISETRKKIEKKIIPALILKKGKISEKLEKLGINNEQDEKKYILNIRNEKKYLTDKIKTIENEFPKLVEEFRLKQLINKAIMPVEKQQKELVNDILLNTDTKKIQNETRKNEIIVKQEEKKLPVEKDRKQKTESKPLHLQNTLFDMDELIKQNMKFMKKKNEIKNTLER